MRLTKISALLTASSALALGGIVTVATAHSGSSSTRNGSYSHHKAARRTVARALVRNFTLFRDGRAHTASSALPPYMDAGAGSIWELDWQSAGYVSPSADAGGLWPVRGLWLVPGVTGVCFVAADKGSTTTTCDPVSRVLGGQAQMAVGDADTTTIIGLAPNDNASVTLITDDGTQTTVPVTDDVWVASAHQQFRSIEVTDSSGVRHTYQAVG